MRPFLFDFLLPDYNQKAKLYKAFNQMKITSAKQEDLRPQQNMDVPGQPRGYFDELRAKSRYCVKPDSIFRVNFGLLERDGRIIPCDVNVQGCEQHWIEFRIWNYKEEMELKKLCSEFDTTHRIHKIDNDKLDRLKVQKLFRAWSLGEKEPDFKINTINGIVPDADMEKFYSLFPAVIHYLLDCMNLVLEGGR